MGIDRGRVVEYGTHNELIQHKGLYYELVTAQSEKEKEKEKEANSDNENEMEESLARQVGESMKARPRRGSRRMSLALRRSSIISTKSAISESSETTHEPVMIGDVEGKRCLTMPFFFKILRLNGPEWAYLLIGGFASLVFGGVMPVC